MLGPGWSESPVLGPITEGSSPKLLSEVPALQLQEGFLDLGPSWRIILIACSLRPLVPHSDLVASELSYLTSLFPPFTLKKN